MGTQISGSMKGRKPMPMTTLEALFLWYVSLQYWSWIWIVITFTASINCRINYSHWNGPKCSPARPPKCQKSLWAGITTAWWMVLNHRKRALAMSIRLRKITTSTSGTNPDSSNDTKLELVPIWFDHWVGRTLRVKRLASWSAPASYHNRKWNVVLI